MIRRYSTSDQMDEWLDSQGFYRKHTAKDGSCLFRAVSEQVFNTQALHLDVRQTCVDYMKRNCEKFEEFIEGSFDNYLSNLNNKTEWAGQVEMTSMSLVFKRDFLIFQEIGKPPFAVTDNGYKDTVMLYFSQGNHYDSVYPKGLIINAAFCQSLVYDTLYKQVFRLGDEVDLAVEKMLHDKAYAKLRKDSVTSVDSNCAMTEFVLDQPESSSDWDEKDLGTEIRRALAQGFPPFPYKVAKALDPEIYRNVEFDVWNEARKDEMTFEPGVKCVVRLNREKPDSYHAHIQEITPNKGPVTVYIVELGEKQTVPYESLEPLPYKAGWQTQNRSYKSLSTSYYQKSHLNGNSSADMDKYKGRKKFYKKGKFKDVALFPIRVPRSHPTILPHQSQFDSSFLPLGRGRGGGGAPPPIPFHAIAPRNTSPNIKWMSQSSRNQRYANGSNGTQYFTTNGYNGNGSRVYDKSIDYGQQQQQQQQNGVQNFPAQTSVTWTKTVAENPSNNQNYNGPASNDSSTTGLQRAVAADNESPSCALPSSSSSSSSNTTQSYSNSVPAQVPLTPPSSSPAIADANVTAAAYGIGGPPQPVTIYSCPYFATGVCVPFDPPLQAINYSVARSQDPSGNDLPFQDVATLRFFFNLGWDYFRMTSGGPQMPPHVVWNYSASGPQMGYTTGPQTTPPINGYLTPVSSSEGAEDSSGGSNTAVASPGFSDGDIASQPQQLPNPVEEMYETAYIYSSSPLSFVPGLWTQSVDYGTPPATIGITSDYKSGLILNEQGVLSLSPCPQFPTTARMQGQIRARSDSGGSCRSQRANGDWNNVNYSNSTGRQKHRGGGGGNQSYEFTAAVPDRGSYSKGPQQQQHHQCQFLQRPGGHQSTEHKKHQHQQSANYPFVGQPLIAYGMSSGQPQAQASTTAFNYANPMLAASPTSLGINYAGGSPVISAQQAAGGGVTAYYSPPHPSVTATLVYSPPTHPIPYFSSAH